MKCPNCRNEIHKSSLVCPYCNYQLYEGRYASGYTTNTEPVYQNNTQYTGYSGRQSNYYDNKSNGYKYDNRTDYQRSHSDKSSSMNYMPILLSLLILILGFQIINILAMILILIQL